MVLNQRHNEVTRNQANEAASHVDNRDRTEAHLADLHKAINLADTFDNLNLLRCFIEELLDTGVTINLWHVISEQWHLFHADSIVIQATID